MLQQFQAEASVLSHTLIKSSKKGTPGLSIRFRYLDPETNTHKEITTDLFLTQKTIDFRLKMLDEVFGWRGGDVSQLHNDGIDTNGFSLVGLPCSLAIEEEEYETENGPRQKMVVKFINRLGSGGTSSEELSADDAKRLSDKIAGSVMAYAQNNGGIKNETRPVPAGNQKASGEEMPPPPEDDSLPF